VLICSKNALDYDSLSQHWVYLQQKYFLNNFIVNAFSIVTLIELLFLFLSKNASQENAYRFLIEFILANSSIFLA